MYIITFVATNNDTYESMELALSPSKKDSEGDAFVVDMFFENLPTKAQIEKMVSDTYDGVWEPDLSTIRVFKVQEIRQD
jgi:hypothetical protein